MRKQAIAVAGTLMLALTTTATNYYVAPTGSNAALGTSPETPFLTIQKAAQTAQAGDTVFVAPGIYSEMDIKPANSGSKTKGYIVFISQQGAASVQMKKTDTTEADNAKSVFDLTGKSYIWLEGFRFIDTKYFFNCVSVNNANHCVVTRCQFINLRNEEMNANWGGTAAIRLYKSSDCVVSQCLFNGIYGDGIDITGQEGVGNLLCHNTFTGLKGTKRSWEATGKYKYSSAVTGQDMSRGHNVIAFNHMTGGQDGIWLDRDGSTNIIVRNFGNGGQRLVFNESRCARNLFQENIALNMTESGFRSALYGDTNWSFDTRYVNNVAYRCKVGFYMHKSQHNEIRNNIVYDATSYCMQFTDSAAWYGRNFFASNLWHITSKASVIQYRGQNITGAQFAQQAGETGGIYEQSPLFVSVSSPFDFTLQAGSPCIGAGDENGVDVGAYPVYGPAPLGRQSTVASGSIGFDEVYAEVMKGDTYTATLRIAKALPMPLTLKVQPVAGDLRQGTDFTLQDNGVVTFAPGETAKQIAVSFMGEETTFSKLLVLKLTDAEAGTTFCARNYLAIVVVSKEKADEQKNADVWLEAEDGVLGSLWNVVSDAKASGGKYVTVKSGNNSSSSAPAAAGWATYQFDVKVANTYTLWLRTICPSSNDDSFWLRIDDGKWSQWNGIPNSTAWKWNKSNLSAYLLNGPHTLDIAYREDGAKLDKILLTCNDTKPEGMGGDPTGIECVYGADDSASQRFYIYSLTGQFVAEVVAADFAAAINNAPVAPNIYVVKRVVAGKSESRKIIKQH